MKKANWIQETEAAAKLGYKPRTLRDKVKKGVLNIAYTTMCGRRFQYNELDIQKTLTNNSNLLHS